MRVTVFAIGLGLLVNAPFCVFSQDFRVLPQEAKQGELLQVFGSSHANRVRMHNRSVPLYPQAQDGKSMALLPIPVLIKPGQYTLEWLDAKGGILHAQMLTVNNAHYPVQNVVLSKTLSALRSTPEERDEVSVFQAQESAVRYWSFPLQPPLDSCLTSLFGVQRQHNGKPTGDFHAGLDQRGAMGTPIHAITAGEVKLAGQFALHGGTVGIDHGQGLKSIYLHMSKIGAKPGDHVQAGDVIGYVGSTGRSTGPHLHWSLYANGVPVNPLQWMHLAPCANTVPRSTAKKRRVN